MMSDYYRPMVDHVMKNVIGQRERNEVVGMLFGIPLDEFSKEQLLAIIEWLEGYHRDQLRQAHESRDKWADTAFKLGRKK